MPKAWSNRDERQYQHIQDSTRERGASQKRSKEIAAKTVNKHRSEEGRTANQMTQGKKAQGKGKSNFALNNLTRNELYNRAKTESISGRSKMTKAELVKALSS